MFTKILTTLAAVVAFAAISQAQVARIPNTGCPNAAYPSIAGQPKIGTGFGIIAAPCRTPNSQPVILFGNPNPVILPRPPACTTGCVLACTPSVILFQSAFRALIPNNPNLVGVRFCAQSACIERSLLGRCINLHGALAIRITN